MKALILACGNGSRLAPYTNRNPKALVPYMGKSSIYHQCRKFLSWGIKEIYVFYSKGNVSDLYRETEKLNISLHPFHLEIGWKNTWKKAAQLFENDDVVIVNCDIMIPQDYQEVISCHSSNLADISIACTNQQLNYEGQLSQLAFIREKGSSLTYHSKDYTIDADVVREIGMSVVSPSIWKLVGEISYDGIDPWRDILLPKAICDGKRLQCIRINACFQDIGTWHALYSSYYNPLPEFSNTISRTGSNIIEENVYIDHSAEILHSIIMRGSVIGANVRLEKAIVLPGTVLEEQHISGMVIQI